MWLSEIINQTLCDKFYTKKYIYEDDEVNQPDTENPSEYIPNNPEHPPAQQPPAQQHPAPNQPPAQQPPAQQPPAQPPAQQPAPINQQVLNKMQPNHVAMATQQFGQAASQFVQQNPLAAGAIGATAAIGTGLMAKKAIQNSRQ
jgi:FtsZ-interacting cell division protein YlmF